MDSYTLAVLGAQDPEMDAVEQLLLAAGIPCVYASPDLHRRIGGPETPTRAIPATAYGTRSLVWPDGRFIPPFGWYPRVILAVECGFPKPENAVSPAELEWWGHGGSADPEVITIDHHRPGDPGYGRPPAEFLPASSIGQVISWLAREGLLPWARPARAIDRMLDSARGQLGGYKFEPPDQREPRAPADPEPGWFVAYDSDGTDHRMLVRVPLDLVLTAAADHCLAAAYAGQCPGVDPSDLRRRRIESVLTQRDSVGRPGRRSAAEVESDLARTEAALRAMPTVDLGGAQVLDLRQAGILSDLPEVACILGVGYLSAAPLRSGEPPKIVLGGCGEGTVPGTAPVEAFLGGWAEAHGLVRPYGDPVRGFAGAYLPA